MKNISIIVPIHELTEENKGLLETALKSVEDFHNDVTVLIVGPSSVTKSIVNLSQKLEIALIENNKETDFCSQVNKGIEECKTEWFSILEIDDTYNKLWLNLVTRGIKENPEYNVFFPIVKGLNHDGSFLEYSNESVWAYGFSETIGIIDNELLLDYDNFQISGGLYRTQTIKDAGYLKNNIKLSFGYEFLLRLTHNGNNIMVLPRVGYNHTNLRPNSLFHQLLKNDESKMTEDEVKFWVETAKKEFFFKNKREVKYEKS